MRTLHWVGLVAVLIILQTTFVPLIAFQGVRPDLLLGLIVSCGLLFGKEQGVGIGFFSGLLQDLFTGSFFGLHILSKVTIGYLFGLTEKKVYKRNLLLPIVAVAVTSICYFAVYVFILILFRYKVDNIYGLIQTMLVFAGYNMLFSLPIHLIVYRLGSLNKDS